MVPYAGFEMPVSYAGLVIEHNAVQKLVECLMSRTWASFVSEVLKRWI